MVINEKNMKTELSKEYIRKNKCGSVRDRNRRNITGDRYTVMIEGE